MYCPNCKKEYSSEYKGNFCGDCGTRLVDSPKQNDFGVNISDDAAIMGGVNVVRNDTHNTTSFDQSVTYNSTVTNNINKSNIELQQERTQSFIEQCKQAFSAGNGLITEERRVSLETLRLSLGIDEAEAERLIEVARKSSGARMTTLGLRDVTTMKNIDRYIVNNNATMLNGQIARLAALVNNYNIEEIHYKNYMLQAALSPTELMRGYESSTADEYWQTYWASVAYFKCGDNVKAERAIVKLDRYAEYPEDNTLLLSALSTYKDYGVEEAAGYINAVIPEQCSPLLLPFVQALFLEIYPEGAAEFGFAKENCQFYIDNFVW